MPVGSQANSASVNASMTDLATSLRNIMTQVNRLSTQVNGQGSGLAYLQSIGFGSAANPANPGSISDAQYALNMIAYLNTVSGVYFGTATQATTFAFDNALSVLWAGQLG